MPEIKLENLCHDILLQWSKKYGMDEEQSYLLAESIFDMLSHSEREPGVDYQKLSEKLNETWQYRNFDGLSQEKIFLCGSLWGMIQVLESGMRREKQDREVKKLARFYKGKVWFLEAVSQNPGIRHKDLAGKGKQTPSQLSQFVAVAVRDDLVTYNRVGREKYYYLQKLGKQVYEEIIRQRSHEQKIAYRFPYKSIRKTNEEVFVDGIVALGVSAYVQREKEPIEKGSRSQIIRDIIKKNMAIGDIPMAVLPGGRYNVMGNVFSEDMTAILERIKMERGDAIVECGNRERLANNFANG